MTHLLEKLNPLRNEIDRIDSEILTLLNQRARNAQLIGELKGTGTVYNPEREAAILNNLRLKNKGPLSNESIVRLFREIMSECLALERPLIVSYLGPEGTFTQQAAIRHFGHAAKTLSCASIDETFRQVESNQTDYLVTPIENSTEGAVGRTLDLLVSTSLLICGEISLRIHHNLLSRVNDITAIKSVSAHPQALAQCHEWLNKNLPTTIKRIPASSNAEAARLASTDNSVAAIASLIAAEKYQLQTLAANIEDEPNNTTRFLILGHQKTKATGNDKTSLIVSVPNQAGSIHHLLEPFSKYQISMTKLVSRPTQGQLWEYVFFIDIEGHIDDENVQRALQDLKQRTTFTKCIGSYPLSPL